MCLAIPGLVVERQPSSDALEFALVEFAGVRRKVCVSCVPEAAPGDYVLVHAGIAISRIDGPEAQALLAQLHAMGEMVVEEIGP